MNKYFQAGTMMTIVLWLGGCAGAPDAGSNGAANTTNAAVAENASNPGMIAPAFNNAVNVNGMVVPDNVNVVVIDTNKAKPTLLTRPAPDDSEVSMEMNKAGQPVQTRIFKNHPVLLKVEKIYLGPKETKYTVHLKNGRVLPLEEGKLSDFLIAPPQDILAAVGVKNQASPADRDAAGKKTDNP